MKTSRATGSPFAADSCNIKLITNSKASENVQFLNFKKSCLSKPVLIRMKHFPHLAKLQVCLRVNFHFHHFCHFCFTFSLNVVFKKFNCPVYCVYSICVLKSWRKWLSAKRCDVNGTEISCTDNVSKRRRKER